MARTIFYFITALAVIFSCACGGVYAGESVDDGFVSSRELKGRYFTISLAPDVDLRQLTLNLSVPPSIKALIRKPVSDLAAFSLPNQLDLIYLAVSEIMDIRLQKFNCVIKVCKDPAALSVVAERLYGAKLPRTGGFSVPEVDTIYIDAESVTLNVFGHELSHVIQCQYFVIKPPMTIQEVLSGFVEYQLRKETGTLPKRS